MKIVIPIPPKATHPNSHVLWRAALAGKKKQREDANWAARFAMQEARIAKPPRWAAAVVHVTYYRSRGRVPMDQDNLIAWMKHTMDGIQDAGVITNDRHLYWLAPTQLTGKEANGRDEVEIEISEADEQRAGGAVRRDAD